MLKVYTSVKVILTRFFWGFEDDQAKILDDDDDETDL